MNGISLLTVTSLFSEKCPKSLSKVENDEIEYSICQKSHLWIQIVSRNFRCRRFIFQCKGGYALDLTKMGSLTSLSNAETFNASPPIPGIVDLFWICSHLFGWTISFCRIGVEDNLSRNGMKYKSQNNSFSFHPIFYHKQKT